MSDAVIHAFEAQLREYFRGRTLQSLNESGVWEDIDIFKDIKALRAKPETITINYIIDIVYGKPRIRAAEHHEKCNISITYDIDTNEITKLDLI
jgi:hypothetical protein